MQLEKTGNVIKKIKFNKNNVRLVFDNGENILINKNAFLSSYLYVGKKLSEKDINKLNKENNVDKYYEYALKLLSKKSLFKNKVIEKLKLKFIDISNSELNYVINKLIKNHFIDDEKLKDDYIEYYSSLNYGKNKIKEKLIKLGYDFSKSKIIEFSKSEEIEKAKNHIQKLEKKYDKYNNEIRKEKIKSALINLGFSSDVVSTVIKDLHVHSLEEELEILKKDFDKYYNLLKKKYDGLELKDKLINKLMYKGYRYSEISILLEEIDL